MSVHSGVRDANLGPRIDGGVVDTAARGGDMGSQRPGRLRRAVRKAVEFAAEVVADVLTKLIP
ncbi:hypothetical protein TPB0596_43830 [Tsukamurella pulmonis]|nr:hypothetical protein TPB0596_43830 [Tsukamurella pulmonis]